MLLTFLGASWPLFRVARKCASSSQNRAKRASQCTSSKPNRLDKSSVGSPTVRRYGAKAVTLMCRTRLVTYLNCRAATNFSSGYGSSYYDCGRKRTVEGSAMMLQLVSSDHRLFTRSGDYRRQF